MLLTSVQDGKVAVSNFDPHKVPKSYIEATNPMVGDPMPVPSNITPYEEL